MHHWFKNKIISEDVTALGIKPNPVNVDCYHGSGDVFDKFDQSKARIANDHMGGGVGYFTSNKDVAGTYAKSMARKKGTKTPTVYSTKLRMKNVFDVDHKFSGDKLKHVLPDDVEGFARGAGLLKPGTDKYKVLNGLKDGTTELHGHEVFKGLSRGGVDTLKAREHLVKKGFDGIRYNGGVNMDAATKHDVYMPYAHKSITINKREAVNNPAPVQEEKKEQGMKNTYGLPKSLIEAASKIGEASGTKRELDLQAEQEFKLDNGYLSEAWKYHQYASSEEAHDARKKHFAYKNPDGTTCGNACRSMGNGKLAYMGEFKGPKPSKKIAEDVIVEEWSVLDNHTMKIVSKHGDHQAPALTACRTLNSKEFDSSKKKDRYRVVAPGTAGHGVKAATAKKINGGKLPYREVEESEQIDELSKGILKNYGRAARKQINEPFTDKKTIEKRHAGHLTSVLKKNGSPLVKVNASESEQIDELSKDKLDKYYDAARQSARDHGSKMQQEYLAKGGKTDDAERQVHTDKAQAHSDKLHARYASIRIASAKLSNSHYNKIGEDGKVKKVTPKVMASESEQIDELSKDKLDQYVEKATDDAIDHVAKGRNNNKTGIKHFEKATSRYKGVRLARHKIDVKEEQEINEISRKTLKSYTEKSEKEQDEIGARHDDNVLKINASDDSRKFHNRRNGVNDAYFKTTTRKSKIGQQIKVRATTVAQDNARRKAAATNEEEQINEISKKLASSYGSKAMQHLHKKFDAELKHREDNEKPPNGKYHDIDDIQTHLEKTSPKYKQRQAGARLAANKEFGNSGWDKAKVPATNEEEQIEELSHNLLKRYEKKATYSGRANYIKGTFSDNDDEANKNITLAHRRDEGIKKAKQKLSESIMQNLKDILNK